MKILHKRRRVFSVMVMAAIMVFIIVLAVMRSRDYYVKAVDVIRHDVPVMPSAFINHEKPQTAVDGRILIETICDNETKSPYHCWPWKNPFFDWNCRAIYPVDPLLGGLSPSYPIARCDRYFRGFFGDSYLYRRGCLVPDAVSYIVQIDNHYGMIATDYQLRGIFTPIESKGEALAFALARTGYKAYFGQSYTEDYEYFVTVIEDTHVERINDGFQINLYVRTSCGCGQHTTMQVITNVSRDGHVTEISSEVVYRDKDRICYD